MGMQEIEIVSVDNVELTKDGMVVTTTVDWLGAETQVESTMDEKVFMDMSREMMFMWT